MKYNKYLNKYNVNSKIIPIFKDPIYLNNTRFYEFKKYLLLKEKLMKNMILIIIIIWIFFYF